MAGTKGMSELDNPFWSSLQTLHRALALQSGAVARYPSDYAPFLGVEAGGIQAAQDLEHLLAAGESVYLLGVVPTPPPGWKLHAFRPLAQMVCEAPLPPMEGPPVIALTEHHREEVLALTALVYPHYFRRRTMDLGRYFGLYQEGRLAAIIGERLGTPVHREMSAICTHPDYHGRGYARQLTTMLTNKVLEEGGLPFLHVSHENSRAKQLYERLGYRHRRDIGFWSLQR